MSMNSFIEWTHEVVERLIDLYRQRPELWDSKNNNYHIKNKKHAAWTNIAVEIGCDVDLIVDHVDNRNKEFHHKDSPQLRY
ncbi:hypothetical protein FQR65_LT14890 [Abscondita terminalis]|nr:hypothetical protein FQR65_LT14890 [Abscondita terminalis]